MPFELPELPYAQDALSPYISQETLAYHYGKHHKAYVNKLNSAIGDTPFENFTLEQIIMQSSGVVFNNAAQIWNHTFYWHCLKPQGGGKPTGKLHAAIEASFDSFEEFQEKFTACALGQFGSGWAWLSKNTDDTLQVHATSNAGTPMKEGKKALLTCDVWEHAYYIDTRNDRGKYVGNFWNLVNWDFVAQNFDQSS